jgi:hypothetical protein
MPPAAAASAQLQAHRRAVQQAWFPCTAGGVAGFAICYQGAAIARGGLSPLPWLQMPPAGLAGALGAVAGAAATAYALAVRRAQLP